MKSRTFFIVLVLALGAAVYFFGVRPRLQSAAGSTGGAVDKPRVATAITRRANAVDNLLLPGTLQAFVDTPIRARTNGYIAKWLVDIGDRVKAGQTLAVIESPEIDRELNQARASVEQAQANLELARVTADRWKALGRQNAVAQQDIDQKNADYEARRADVDAAKANVERLEQLKGFETVAAPFDGVISARTVDIGTLINAGSGPELFHLSQSDTLRAYLNVPQRYVPDIRVGVSADVEIAEFPHERFPGKVARFAGALDAASRTLQVEVEIPNRDGRLFAGMFCEIRLHLTTANPSILIPSNDAIIRSSGTLVAVVTDHNTVHLQAVKLGRDFGTQIEVLDGLSENARIVENPVDTLSEGEAVEPIPTEAPVEAKH
jgi:membrane fusion protein, multidrug efflux system